MIDFFDSGYDAAERLGLLDDFAGPGPWRCSRTAGRIQVEPSDGTSETWPRGRVARPPRHSSSVKWNIVVINGPSRYRTSYGLPSCATTLMHAFLCP